MCITLNWKVTISQWWFNANKKSGCHIPKLFLHIDTHEQSKTTFTQLYTSFRWLCKKETLIKLIDRCIPRDLLCNIFSALVSTCARHAKTRKRAVYFFTLIDDCCILHHTGGHRNLFPADVHSLPMETVGRLYRAIRLNTLTLCCIKQSSRKLQMAPERIYQCWAY